MEPCESCGRGPTCKCGQPLGPMTPFMERMIRGMLADLGHHGKSESHDFEYKGHSIHLSLSVERPEGSVLAAFVVHPDAAHIWESLAAEYGLRVDLDSARDPRAFGLVWREAEPWEATR